MVRPDGRDATQVTDDLASGYTGLSWSPDQRFFVAQAWREPVVKRSLTAYTLWDSGGLTIEMAGDNTPRFRSGIRAKDGSETLRELSDSEARAWFSRFNIPFPRFVE
jgi:hypothetical protein